MPSAAGAQPFFPPLQRVPIEPIACTDPAAYGLHLARWDCRSFEQVVEGAIVGSVHPTTMARLLADASLQPHRRRYGKTATVEERLTTKAANMLWRYARAGVVCNRGEAVLCLDEKPPMQVLARRGATRPLPGGQMACRAFESARHGAVTWLASLSVDEGLRWGCGLEANDHGHVLRPVTQLVRWEPRAQRLHRVIDHGASHIAHETRPSLATPPVAGVPYTTPRELVQSGGMAPARLLG